MTLTLQLLLRGVVRGKARAACAVFGIAAACGACAFTFSLSATNAAQAPARARRATAPWAAWRAPELRGGPRAPKGRPPEAAADLALDLVFCTIDYRPGGRVLQGPPMRAVVAAAPAESPYERAPLVEGRWVDGGAAACEVVCTRRALRRFGRGEPPPVGTALTFVGRKGTMTATLVGYLADAQLPRDWPNVFANRAAFGVFRDEEHGTLALWRRPPSPSPPGLQTADAPGVVAAFTGDGERRMGYARPLMLAAAVLTALSLLVNALLLSVEANRRTLALLRTAGLTRGGVAGLVAAEALLAAAAGCVLGCGGAWGALALYVATDAAAFPTGAVLDWGALRAVGACALAVALVAALFALRPALAVRPLDALEARPQRRRRGMAVAFACGFAAFVAVEVWGASLMRGFVPSKEWPDAIVSILPEGVSSFDVEKLRALPGVKRISELCPLQLDFDPEEEMTLRGGGGLPPRGPRRKPCRNALFLAAEWLPDFTFVEGTREAAVKALAASGGCVIAEMISRARNLHVGDTLRVALPGRGPKTVAALPVVGVVDLNWHMVTSRGLVRGLNGAPVMTDGPVFVSLDTLESLDPRPAAAVKMTHLWVEYAPAFLKEKGVFPAGRAVEAAIAQALGLSPGDQPASTVRLHARDEIADGTLAHGSDLIGQMARVPFIFLAVLSLGFVAMLVADADAAKHAFAVLRAVGATRAQLAARLAGGALRTAAWGVLFGLPAGALAGWLFSFRTARIWPGMPHYFVVPWGVIAEGTLGALVFVLAVAVPTALVLVGRGAPGTARPTA